MKTCPHCKGDTAVRNPSGYCDHLYYPDNCAVCKKIAESNPMVILKEKIVGANPEANWYPNTCGCDRCSQCTQGSWPLREITLDDVLIALRAEYKDAYIKWDEHALYMYTGTDSALFAGWILGKRFSEQEDFLHDFLNKVLWLKTK